MTLTEVAVDQIDAHAALGLTRRRLALVHVDLAAVAGEAGRTLALVRVDSVDTGGVDAARHGQTLVYVDLTVGARVARHTVACEVDQALEEGERVEARLVSRCGQRYSGRCDLGDGGGGFLRERRRQTPRRTSRHQERSFRILSTQRSILTQRAHVALFERGQAATFSE